MTLLPKLMVAPNGARKSKADHPAIPISLAEIITTAIDCHQAGADGLHLHLRDSQGNHILDAGLYTEALSELCQVVPGMMLQITTEAVGQYTPVQQRHVVMQVQPKSVSISLAEMLSEGDTKDAISFYAYCAEAGIAVQHILYGRDDLSLMFSLLDGGHLSLENLHLLFVLGRYAERQQSKPADLQPFTEWLNVSCPTAEWAVCAFGKCETECLAAAIHLGGKVRVGFENSFWNADGSLAQSNAERVREIKILSR